MPSILFASNSVSHFPGSELRNTPWGYDMDRVPYAIYTPPETFCSTPIFGPTSTGETWIHFRHGAEEFHQNVSEPICEIVDESGNRIAYLSVRDLNTYGYRLDIEAEGQEAFITRWMPVLDQQMRTFDIQVKSSGVLLEVRVYINEILVLTRSLSVTAEVVPRFLRIGGHSGFSNDAYGGLYSEIIVADGDTRNSRLDLLRPVAAGAYNNWNGPISSLADDDPTTGMTTTLPNQNQSTVLTPYTGATNISNIVQVTTSVRGINSPAGLQHLIRMGGVDYTSGTFPIPYAKEFQVTDWKINPATSQPWEASDLSGTEFGFRSIA